jgi:hypothetical protein
MFPKAVAERVTPLAPAESAQGRIYHGAANPGGKLLGPTDRGRSLQQLEKDSLSHVFRLGHLTRDPEGDP